MFFLFFHLDRDLVGNWLRVTAFAGLLGFVGFWVINRNVHHWLLTAEKQGIKNGEAQKFRNAARPLMNIYQGFLEGPHISETNEIVSDLQGPPMKLLDSSLDVITKGCHFAI